MDAPPVFEAREHVFDLVALFVEDGVMRDRGFAVGFGRNAGGDAALGEGGAEPVGVVNPCRPEVAWLSAWRTASTRRPCSRSSAPPA